MLLVVVMYTLQAALAGEEIRHVANVITIVKVFINALREPIDSIWMAALGCDFNRSMQHIGQNVQPVF